MKRTIFWAEATGPVTCEESSVASEAVLGLNNMAIDRHALSGATLGKNIAIKYLEVELPDTPAMAKR